MRNGSRDFLSGEAIQDRTFFDDRIDIHHIFPKSWCVKEGITSAVYDSIINKTAISARSNRSIGGRRPSEYMITLEKNSEISRTDMNDILTSHLISSSSLRTDDFVNFFAERAESLLCIIETAMDRSITREKGLFRLGDSIEANNIAKVIDSGESSVIEFKSSLRTNLHTHKHDSRMELAVLKTLAAFLNSHGGTLVIGVSDDGTPTGIDADGFNTPDKMVLHLRNIVVRSMGAVAMSQIQISTSNYSGQKVMVVICTRSGRPVFVTEGNEQRLYIRTGPSTTSLAIDDATVYIKDHFPRF